MGEVWEFSITPKVSRKWVHPEKMVINRLIFNFYFSKFLYINKFKYYYLGNGKLYWIKYSINIKGFVFV